VPEYWRWTPAERVPYDEHAIMPTNGLELGWCGLFAA
jgi:hypothetical protein